MGFAAEAVRWSAPSVLTLGALLSGLTAVRFASEEDFSTSVFLVMVAAVLDGLDGHVARYLNAVTSLGFELDSLCDLANFGVSPALIVYFWAKALPTADCSSERCSVENAIVWASCCAHAGCCAFRLARFNVAGHAAQMDKQTGIPQPPNSPRSSRPPVRKAVLHNVFQRKMYFKGVPAPVGATYALTPMMLRFAMLGPLAVGRRGTAVILFVTAMLMVTPLPTFSSKMLKTDPEDSHLRSRHVVSSMVKAVGGLVVSYLAWNFPFRIILLLNFSHFLSIPIAVAVFTFCTTTSEQDGNKHE